MVSVTKRYLTKDDLDTLEANPEAFRTFLPNGCYVWIIGEAKKHRSHKDGVLDADVITPSLRMRLVKYDAVQRKAIWAEWPAGMTVVQHTRLYKRLAKLHAKIMPTLPKPKEAKTSKEVNPLSALSKKELDKLKALLKAA